MTAAIAPVQTLQEWHSPASRPEDMHELIQGVDRYNPTNLSFMEEYLLSQVRDGTYDLLANLAILKLYQFNPHLSNPEIITHILLKALSSSVSGPDFNLCLALLREPALIVRDSETEDQAFVAVVPYLQSLHALLRVCNFAEFWVQWNGKSEGAQALQESYVPQHPHLLSDLRLAIARTVAATFSRVKLAQLARWLDIPQAEVAQWVTDEAGWSVDGEAAEVPKNGDNDVKAGVVKENIQLSQLTKLIAAAAV